MAGRVRRTTQRVLLLGSIGLAGLVATARAQGPMTRNAFKSVLDDATKTSKLVDSINARIVDVSRRGYDVAQEITRHNADQCTAPPDQPQLCADYQREGQDLNASLSGIQKEWAGYETSRRPLRAHFGKLMDQLRNASYPGGLAPFKARVVDCSNLEAFPDVLTCLTKVWQEMP